MIIHVPWANSAFKIKPAVAGHRALTPEVARKSFVEAGLWPMNYQFLDRFTPSQVIDNTLKRRVRNIQTRSENVIRNSRLSKARYEFRRLLAEIRRLTSAKKVGANCNG